LRILNGFKIPLKMPGHSDCKHTEAIVCFAPQQAKGRGIGTAFLPPPFPYLHRVFMSIERMGSSATIPMSQVAL
jgi:hypothetical protein